MTRKVLVADLFCGAGGSSSGAKRALARRGLRMDLVAVNHWNIAVETHAKNHPELARAMGFSDAEVEYEFCGTKTEITKQIGNAVSVEQAEALVGAIFDSAAARGGLVA